MLKYFTGIFDACGDIKLFYFGRQDKKNIYRVVRIENSNTHLLRKVKNYFNYGLVKDKYWVIDKKDKISDFCSRISIYSSFNPVRLDLLLKSCNIIFGSDKSKQKPQAVEIHNEIVNIFSKNAQSVNDITFSSPPDYEWMAGFIDGNENRFDISLVCKQEDVKYSIKKTNIVDKKIDLSFCVLEFENKKSLIEYLQQVIPFLSLEKESIFLLLNKILPKTCNKV